MVWFCRRTRLLKKIIMRGIARASFFKPPTAEKSYGAPTVTLPQGLENFEFPQVLNVNAVLYNPKNLPYGGVAYSENTSAALTSIIKTRAVNAPKPPAALVTLTACYKPNSSLFVAMQYSTHWGFNPAGVTEKNMIIPANSGVTFSLYNLSPATSYYVRVQARAIGEKKESAWMPSPTILITMPVAPSTGVFAGVYHINSEPTGLSLNGTGEWNGIWYVRGTPTTLVNTDALGWTGVYLGQQYFYGNVAHGFIDGAWWYHGTASDEFFFNGGNGWHYGLFYQNFAPFTGKYDGHWYGAGHYKPWLDGDGYGNLDGLTYYAGAPYTGTLGGTYYYNGQTTTLGPGGTGTWNNQYFSGGAFIGNVGNPYDSGQTSSQGSRFSSGVTYG